MVKHLTVIMMDQNHAGGACDSVPAIRDFVVVQLRMRDKKERSPFEDLINSRTKLLHENMMLENTQANLSKQISIQTEELRQLREASGIEGGGSKCQKCASMQDELTRNLREKADDKQQILKMTQQVRDQQGVIEKMKLDMKEMENTIRTMREEQKSAVARMKDVEASLQVAVEECGSRTIEIDRLKPELHKLQAENFDLVNELLKLKGQMADKYNEIHSLMEEVESKKRIAEAATSSSNVVASPEVKDDGIAASEPVSFLCRLPQRAKQTIVAHEKSEIHALAHNSSGAMLLTGSDDRTMKLWDARTSSRLATFSGAIKAVMCVAFSNDGNYVLGASGDFAVRLWSLKTKRILHTLTGHQSKIYTAGFTPDSRHAFSGGYDRMIKLWDLHEGLVFKTIACSSSCNDAVVTQEGSVIVSVHLDNSIRLWDFRTGSFEHEMTGVHSQPITSVCMYPGGTDMVLTNSRDDSLALSDFRKYSCVRKFQHSTYRNGVNWNRATASPDGKFIAAGGSDGSIFVWEAEDGNLVSQLRNVHRSAVVACSWATNDQLASIEKEHQMVIWE
uniref:Autophagy-related protein 16 domain-containing protein n=1 Tax=Hanusia phi TaxID=3032 RepID=A0A7S0EKL9_9CRYP